MERKWNNEILSRHKILILWVFFLACIISDCFEIPLCKEWAITNENNSKIRNYSQFKTIGFHSCMSAWYNCFSGILVRNETLPSGVYSALKNAKVTDSVLNSFNDVDLRWIAREKWTYSLEFDGT